MWRSFLHLTARTLPTVHPGLRPFLHRLRGVEIYGDVWIGDDVYIDEDFPETVEIHEGAAIATRCTIIGHTGGCGKVVIGKYAAVGAGCLIVCASGKTVTIGEGAVISAGTTVTHDIPPYTLCGAPRIKAYGKVTVPYLATKTHEEFTRGVKPIKATINRPSPMFE